MAKTTKKKPTTTAKKYEIKKGVPMPFFTGKKSPNVKFAAEYQLVDSLKAGECIIFDTDPDLDKFRVIRHSIEQTNKHKKRYSIRSLNDKESGIWRDDKRKMWSKTSKKTE